MRRFNRSRRPPTQWIPCDQTAQSLVANTITTTVLVDAQAGETGTTLPVPQIARMTILRIVGEISLLNTESGVFNVIDVGIGVFLANNAASPVLQASRDYPWMYLRQWVLHSPAQAFGDRNDDQPPGSHVDITVKRILKPQEQLLLVVNATLGTASLKPYLRTLIGRVA